MNNLIISSTILGLCIGLSNGFHTVPFNKIVTVPFDKVVISNQLEHRKLLKVHCKANNEDPGEKILKIGEEYEFSFIESVWQTIRLISCKLDQGPNFKHHQEFVAYDAKKAFATSCKWIAREDGIYYSLDKSPPAKKYNWDSPHFLKK